MTSEKQIKRLLAKYKSGKISLRDIVEELNTLPYRDLGFAKLDTHRSARRGFPEVVYCGGKSIQHLSKIVDVMSQAKEPLLLTKASPDIYRRIKDRHKGLLYNEQAQLVYLKTYKKPVKKGLVAVVSAGTSDIPVAEEARVTLEVMGNKVRTIYDVGVAGPHRLLFHVRPLRKANVIVVVAGMEGALASVVSGLTSRPVVAVPTSVGYGASFKGIAPLLTMLNSCSPGVAVVNIDNGFGAGYLASLINT